MIDNKRQAKINDLKSIALARCVDIFHDYELSEVNQLPPSVKGAWKIGRDLAALDDQHQLNWQ